MSVDERYLMEWVEWGLRELERYLTLHDRFERYLMQMGRL